MGWGYIIMGIDKRGKGIHLNPGSSSNVRYLTASFALCLDQIQGLPGENNSGPACAGGRKCSLGSIAT